ncbi:MAG: META domain-containing protein [Halobacteriota archaeon]
MAKRSLIVLTSIVILAALMAAGCVNSTTPSSSPSPASAEALAPFEGTAWTLTSLLTEEGTTNVLPNTTITAAFNNGNATGSSGCNRYFGHYDLSGQNNITFTSLGSTVMYCDTPGVMTQETTYMALLQNTTTYTMSADTLSLLNGVGQVQLRFSPVNATA